MDAFVESAPKPRLALARRSLRAAGDDRLIAQMRNGDEPAARNAFEILYDRHHRGVLAFCRHMLGSLEEAEDAVQHTFSSAFRALLADDREIAVRAWLYAIARNRCLSMLAARREHVALDDVEQLLPSTAGLAREVEQRSDLRELLGDLQRLPDDQRAALVLSELEAHSHKEIADILGVAPSKVKALVFQARETLMIRRQARKTDCCEIREQLSVLRGGALRRRELRRHVESCGGCQVFEVEVRRQRAGIAVLLPVAPTIALKQGTLASAFAAASASSAAGVATVAGGGAAAGGIVLGAKAIGVKALVAVAMAGSAGGGGYVAVAAINDARKDPAPATAPEVQRAPAENAPAASGAAPAASGAAPAAAGAAPAAAGAAPAAVLPAVTPATATPPATVATPAAKETNNAAAGVTGAERATDSSDGRSGGTASAGRSENATTSSARAIDNKTTAAAKQAAARARSEAPMVLPERAAGSAAERGAERRAEAQSRADALPEAARKREAADAAQRARERAAAQAPPAMDPDTSPPPLPAPAAERRPERRPERGTS